MVHNTFAIDPNFRANLAHNWQLSAQRDVPYYFLWVMATYSGVQGTRLMQQGCRTLPNTSPADAANPSVSCPSGFVYLTSNGRARRAALQVQLRRRLSNGFTELKPRYQSSPSVPSRAICPHRRSEAAGEVDLEGCV